MSKKKREHVVFDQMLKPKKSIPFSVMNKQNTKNNKTFLNEYQEEFNIHSHSVMR